MSIHVCSNCGHQEEIFGSRGGNKLADKYELEVLAKLPLDINVRLGSDMGVPVASSDNLVASIYADLATKVLHNLSSLGRDYSSKLGKLGVVKQNN